MFNLLPLLIQLQSESILAQFSVLLDFISHGLQHLLWSVVGTERLLGIEKSLLLREQLLISPLQLLPLLVQFVLHSSLLLLLLSE